MEDGCGKRVDGNGLLKGRQASGREGRATRVGRLSWPLRRVGDGWMSKQCGEGNCRDNGRGETGEFSGAAAGVGGGRQMWTTGKVRVTGEDAVMVERTADRVSVSVSWRPRTEVASGNTGPRPG